MDIQYEYRAESYSHTFGWRRIDGWYDDIVDAHWHQRLWLDVHPGRRTRIVRRKVVSEAEVVTLNQEEEPNG